MIEFIKPANLDGNVLEAELAKAGIAIPERAIFVVGDKVLLPIDPKDTAKTQTILDSFDA